MKNLPGFPSIDELVTRIDGALPAGGGRLIGFIASGRGEGTSTLAERYAVTAAARSRRRVLLLGVGSGSDAPAAGVLQALAAATPIDDLLRPLRGADRREGGAVSTATGGLRGSMGDEARGDLWDLVSRPELWQQLRGRFDEVVLDLPASSDSGLGVAIAPQCDGIVVVVEAEKTRAPVVAHLVASLRAVRAQVLGTVLNKRRFHLPSFVYRRL